MKKRPKAPIDFCEASWPNRFRLARQGLLVLLLLLLFLWFLGKKPLLPRCQNALKHPYQHGMKLFRCLIQARDSEE